MARADQLFCDSEANKSRDSRNKDTHIPVISGL
jgi:hypothetical protein